MDPVNGADLDWETTKEVSQNDHEEYLGRDVEVASSRLYMAWIVKWEVLLWAVIFGRWWDLHHDTRVFRVYQEMVIRIWSLGQDC